MVEKELNKTGGKELPMATTNQRMICRDRRGNNTSLNYRGQDRRGNNVTKR